MKNKKIITIIGIILIACTTLLVTTVLNNKSHSLDEDVSDFIIPGDDLLPSELEVKSFSFNLNSDLSNEEKTEIESHKFQFIVYWEMISRSIYRGIDYYRILPKDDSIMAIVYNKNNEIKDVYTYKDLIDHPLGTLEVSETKYLPIEIYPGEKIRVRTGDGPTFIGLGDKVLVTPGDSGNYYGYLAGGISESAKEDEEVKVMGDTSNKYYSVDGLKHYQWYGNGSLTLMKPTGVYIKDNNITISREVYPFTIKKVWYDESKEPSNVDECYKKYDLCWNTPLSGARFRITGKDINNNDVNILTKETDENGLVTVYLPKNKNFTIAGSYEIAEEIVPNGFKDNNYFNDAYIAFIESENQFDMRRFESSAGMDFIYDSNGIPVWVNAKISEEPIEEPTIETGNIKITKKAYGLHRKDKEFDIKVTLSDTGINGTYGDATFTNGVATFKIKYDEEKILSNIPIGITYNVEEINNSNYKVTYKNNTGIVTKNQTKDVTITNEENYIAINKVWSFPNQYGQVVYNDNKKEYEYKIMNSNISSDDILSAVFEITFDNISDGEYEYWQYDYSRVSFEESLNRRPILIDKFIVQNNKATLELNFKNSADPYLRKLNLIRIWDIPVGTEYDVKEISSTIENNNDNKFVDKYYKTNYSNTINFIFNMEKLCEENIVEDGAYKLKFAKDNINNNDKNKEYEFTIIPLHSYITGGIHGIRNESGTPLYPYGWIQYEQTYPTCANFVYRPDLLYSMWLHGEDSDKVVDKAWFDEHIDTFWDISSVNHFMFETYLGGFDLESLLKDMNLQSIFTNGFINGFVEFPINLAAYGDSDIIEHMVEKINQNTNNFFELEGKHLIEVSKKLENELRNKGFSSTDEWINDTAQRLQNETDKNVQTEIVDDFINCFTKSGYTVDDFRFLRITGFELLSVDPAKNIFIDKPPYEAFLEKATGFNNNVLNSIYGRTFKLKAGESIDLEFPATFPYEYGVLILEKKTEDMDYEQDKSVMLSMQHVEEVGNDLVANVVYKNTYPKEYKEFEIYKKWIDDNKEHDASELFKTFKIFDSDNKDITSTYVDLENNVSKKYMDKNNEEKNYIDVTYDKILKIWHYKINNVLDDKEVIYIKEDQVENYNEPVYLNNLENGNNSEYATNKSYIVNTKKKENEEVPKPIEPPKKEETIKPVEEKKDTSIDNEVLPKTLDDIFTYVFMFGGSIIFIVLIVLGINKTKNKKKGD